MGYLISVILPVYNVKTYLPAALASLQQQTLGFDRLQVIFADDCSTDGSWELLQQYKQRFPNVKAIRLDKNSGGCGQPRNKGLEFASAPYICYLDPDDTLPPDAYETLYEAIEGSDCEIATGWYDIWDEQGNRVSEKCGEVYELQTSRIFEPRLEFSAASATLPMVWCKIYRRDFVVAKNIVFEAGIPGEDQLYTVWCYLEAEKIRYIDRCVYHYTQRQGSLSQNLHLKYFLGIARCCELCTQLFSRYNRQPEGRKFVGHLVEWQMRLTAVSRQLTFEEREQAAKILLKQAPAGEEGMYTRIAASTIPLHQAASVLVLLAPIQEEFFETREFANALRVERDRVVEELGIYKNWVSHLKQQVSDERKKAQQAACLVESMRQELLAARESGR